MFILSPTFSAKTLLTMLHEIRAQIAAYADDPTFHERETLEKMREELVDAICTTVSELS